MKSKRLGEFLILMDTEGDCYEMSLTQFKKLYRKSKNETFEETIENFKKETGHCVFATFEKYIDVEVN